MEGYDYDATASAIKIEDITTDETNREILRKLKEYDPEFDQLVVCSTRDDDDFFCDNAYCPKSPNDMEWLGYHIGNNSILQGLHFNLNPFEDYNHAIEAFCRGVNCNRSNREFSSKA